MYHEVQSGESLHIIAINYGISVDRILSLNPHLYCHPNQISPGQRIRVR